MGLIEKATAEDIKKWSEFLAEAGSNCSYESNAPEAKRKIARANFRIIGPYKKDRLSYTDVYAGDIWFHGIELLEDKGDLAWVRLYGGGITKPEFMRKEMSAEVYKDLKYALKRFPRRLPFRRGPDEIELWSAGRVYRDSCEGDFSNFSGKEDIRSFVYVGLGEEIYNLAYAGGTTNNPEIRKQLSASPIYQILQRFGFSQHQRELDVA